MSVAISGDCAVWMLLAGQRATGVTRFGRSTALPSERHRQLLVVSSSSIIGIVVAHEGIDMAAAVCAATSAER